MWAGWQLAGAGEWASTWWCQRALVGRFDCDDQIGAVCYHHICHLYNTFTTEYMHYNYVSKNSARQADSHCILSSSSSIFIKHKYSFPVRFSPFGMWHWVSGLALLKHFKWNLGRILLGLHDPWWRTHYIPSKQGKSMTQWHTVSQAGIPEPSIWLGKPQDSHASQHSQELTAGLCHEPDKSTQLSTNNILHVSCLHSDLWSVCSLQPSIHPSVCVCLPQPTPLSFNQPMQTTKHEDPYHMSQLKSFHLFSPFTNVYPGR